MYIGDKDHWKQIRVGEEIGNPFDEMLWFTFCTFHSLSFGDYSPYRWSDRTICCIISFMGYYFVIFMISLVLLSQLTGEQRPTLLSTPQRIFKAAFPSFCVLFVLFFILAGILTILEQDNENQQYSYGDSVYYIWCIFHRVPFGELIPQTVGGKVLSGIIAILGILYVPYIIALVSIRKPTVEQHQNLIGALKNDPLDVNLLGQGYTVPLSDNPSNMQDEKQIMNFEMQKQQLQQQD